MSASLGYVAVFFGAGVGGVLRHAVNRMTTAAPGAFPWSTFAVNVTGGLALGLIAGWFAFRGDASQTTKLFLVTGVLGGYTTFSAFSLDAVLLYERGAYALCATYVAASVLACIALLAIGLYTARHVFA